MPLESVDYIERSNSLPLGVLGVGDRVSDDGFKEELEDSSSFIVDETRDSLDTSSSSETSDSGLGNTLDVVS